MDEKNTYYQRNRERLLNKTTEYYKNSQKRIREKARNKYRELSEEEKNIKKRVWKK